MSKIDEETYGERFDYFMTTVLHELWEMRGQRLGFKMNEMIDESPFPEDATSFTASSNALSWLETYGYADGTKHSSGADLCISPSGIALLNKPMPGSGEETVLTKLRSAASLVGSEGAKASIRTATAEAIRAMF